MPISVVIPTRSDSNYLDLCLKSLFENQTQENEIIVMVDGYVDAQDKERYHAVFEKYKGLQFVELEENKGQIYCHNHGVFLSSNEQILFLNADNVVCRKWDDDVRNYYSEISIVSFPQIEPKPSIYPWIILKDFGTTPETFQYNSFLNFVDNTRHPYNQIYGQCLWPISFNKERFMRMGGIDTYFPSPALADLELIMRFEMNGIRSFRSSTYFYHFSGAGTKSTPEKAAQHAEKERQSFEYFKYKWGFDPQRDPETYSIKPKNTNIRGVQF